VVRATLAAVPIHLLQFHGDEDEAYCRQFDRPYIKAARVRPGMDLVQYAAAFPSAQAILLDAFVDGYGGGGKVFDWSLVPPSLGKPLILSGGLDADNVGAAVRRYGPAAVDVSSGVEAARESRMAKRSVPSWPQSGRANELSERLMRNVFTGLIMRRNSGGLTRTCWRHHSGQAYLRRRLVLVYRMLCKHFVATGCKEMC
jgi:hypothetical protein